MKFQLIKVSFFCILLSFFTSCVSKYKVIEPAKLNYLSQKEMEDVSFEYKYHGLEKQCAKKAQKKGISLATVKISNNSERDLQFGKDLKVTYSNGKEVYLLESSEIYSEMKQKGAKQLLWLLLSPVNLYTSNGQSTTTIPIGIAAGAGLTTSGILTTSSANKRFKNQLMELDLNGVTIEKGETKYGMIGMYSSTPESLDIKID